MEGLGEHITHLPWPRHIGGALSDGRHIVFWEIAYFRGRAGDLTSCYLWLDFHPPSPPRKPSLLLSPSLSDGFVGAPLSASEMRMIQLRGAALRKPELSSWSSACLAQ